MALADHLIPLWTGKRPERVGAFAGHWAQAGMSPWSSVGTLFWPNFPFVTRQMSVPEAITGQARGWVFWGCAEAATLSIQGPQGGPGLRGFAALFRSRLYRFLVWSSDSVSFVRSHWAHAVMMLSLRAASGARSAAAAVAVLFLLLVFVAGGAGCQILAAAAVSSMVSAARSLRRKEATLGLPASHFHSEEKGKVRGAHASPSPGGTVGPWQLKQHFEFTMTTWASHPQPWLMPREQGVQVSASGRNVSHTPA